MFLLTLTLTRKTVTMVTALNFMFMNIIMAANSLLNSNLSASSLECQTALLALYIFKKPLI